MLRVFDAIESWWDDEHIELEEIRRQSEMSRETGASIMGFSSAYDDPDAGGAEPKGNISPGKKPRTLNLRRRTYSLTDV